MSKDDAISTMNNSNLIDKKGVLDKIASLQVLFIKTKSLLILTKWILNSIIR